MNTEIIGKNIVHAALQVHTQLGPGLLESVYQSCLTYELKQMGHTVECEVVLPISYKCLQFTSGFRIDMLIDKCVIVENKNVEMLLPIHTAQLITYLKLANKRIGYLLNWNVVLIKEGIKRLTNHHATPI